MAGFFCTVPSVPARCRCVTTCFKSDFEHGIARNTCQYLYTSLTIPKPPPLIVQTPSGCVQNPLGVLFWALQDVGQRYGRNVSRVTDPADVPTSRMTLIPFFYFFLFWIHLFFFLLSSFDSYEIFPSATFWISRGHRCLIFIAHRVHSAFPPLVDCHRMLLAHALALSVIHFVCKKNIPSRECTR